MQTLTIGRRKYVLLTKADYEKLAAQAERQTEDDYWTQAALDAESRARVNGEKPIALDEVERELETL